MCLAIEDSPAGVTAARRAGMTVLAVPSTHAASPLSEADATIASLRSVHVTRSEDGSLEVAV